MTGTALYDAFDARAPLSPCRATNGPANTSLGGDRNVFYRTHRPADRRSSHALVLDQADLATDCYTARDLFAAA